MADADQKSLSNHHANANTHPVSNIQCSKGECSSLHRREFFYFLQSDVIPTLLAAGVEVILLADDYIRERIATQFSRPGADGRRAAAETGQWLLPESLFAARGRVVAHQHRSTYTCAYAFPRPRPARDAG
jgi:hypothetical protein